MKTENNDLLKKGFIYGGIIGFVLLIVSFILASKYRLQGVYIYSTIGLPFMLAEGLAYELDLCSGESCLGFSVIGGILFSAILGLLITYLILLYKNRKKEGY